MVGDYKDGTLPIRSEQGRLVFPKHICVSGLFCLFHFFCTQTCHTFLLYAQSIPSNPGNLDYVQIYLLSPKNVLLLISVFFQPRLYFIGQAPVAQLSRSKSPMNAISCN